MRCTKQGSVNTVCLSVQAAAGAVTLVRDSPHSEGGGEAVQGMHGPAEPHLRGG